MPYIVFLMVTLCGVVLTGAVGFTHGKASVQRLWDAEKMTQARHDIKVLDKTREKEQSAQTLVNTTQKEKDAKIKTLDAAYQRVADRVRNRPEHPALASVPENPGSGDPGRGCSGAELYRDDAALIAAELRRAEIIRLHLIQRQSVDEEVRKKFNATD